MIIQSIPFTGIPPTQRYAASAVYDELEHRIIIFGGYDKFQQIYSSDLYAFDIYNYTWSEILPGSSIIPEGLYSPYTYLRSDRTLLVFYGLKYSGISSDVYSFDLITYSWKLESLTGDKIIGRNDFGATTFQNSQNETFIGIFGGITQIGASNELFL